MKNVSDSAMASKEKTRFSDTEKHYSLLVGNISIPDIGPVLLTLKSGHHCVWSSLVFIKLILRYKINIGRHSPVCVNVLSLLHMGTVNIRLHQ